MFGHAFGQLVDHVLFSDASLTLLGVIVFPIAHVLALIGAIKVKEPRGVYAVTAALAFLVLFYLLSQPEYFSDIFQGGSDPLWAPAGAEFVALCCAIGAFIGFSAAIGLTWAFFLLHGVLLAGFVLIFLVGGGVK